MRCSTSSSTFFCKRSMDTATGESLGRQELYERCGACTLALAHQPPRRYQRWTMPTHSAALFCRGRGCQRYVIGLEDRRHLQTVRNWACSTRLRLSDRRHTVCRWRHPGYPEAGGLIQPRAEGEIAFNAQSIARPGVTRERVGRHQMRALLRVSIPRSTGRSRSGHRDVCVVRRVVSSARSIPTRAHFDLAAASMQMWNNAYRRQPGTFGRARSSGGPWPGSQHAGRFWNSSRPAS
jgi:hypothetical protein